MHWLIEYLRNRDGGGRATPNIPISLTTMGFKFWIMDFGFRFWASQGSMSASKIDQIGEKTASKKHHIFDRFRDRFFVDFWSVLGAKMGPCWGSFRPRTASGSARGRKSAQIRPLARIFIVFHLRPKKLQDPSGTPPGPLRHPSKDRLEGPIQNVLCEPGHRGIDSEMKIQES